MSEVVDQSLQKIAKGTGIIFIGTIIGMLLAFLGRVLVARSFTQAEYGIYSLALVLLNIFVTISLFGLQDGAARQIGYYRGRNDSLKVKGIIFSSIQIVLIASIISSILLFFASDILSTKIFHDPALTAPLKVLAFAIPFLALTQLFVSIFRGFESVKEKVYFQDILRNVLFPAFLIPVVILGLPFIDAIYAFAASIIITFVAFAFYVLKKIPLSLRDSKSNLLATNPVGKELFFFSIPLLGVYLLNQIMNWTDTLTLGFFKTSKMVGLYNGAAPIAGLIGIILSSVGFIYVPVISQLYSKNQLGEIDRGYKVLTKWILSITLPIFLIVFLFPEAVLSFLFGFRYTEAAFTLQILALGFFIHALMGPNGATLIITGKTRFLMWSTFVVVVTNIILNIALIPIFGIAGAAFATTSALAMKNIFWSVKLYYTFKIHPFTKNYLKPVAASVIPILLIYMLVNHLLSATSFWILPLFLILFLVAYSLSILFTRSFDREDIFMLLTLERRLELDLTVVKNVLKEFIK